MFKKIINLIKGKRCFRCGSRLQKSELPDYTYYCKNCNEDFYSIEQEDGGIFRRFDFVNEEKEADTIYKNKKAVIDDATRFYHEHFSQEDDYDENFEVKTYEQALEFWECNGYEIKGISDHKHKETIDKLRNIIELLLYDDLNDYLMGVRDCLNIVQNVDFIDIDESMKHIENEVNKLIENKQ